MTVVGAIINCHKQAGPARLEITNRAEGIIIETVASIDVVMVEKAVARAAFSGWAALDDHERRDLPNACAGILKYRPSSWAFNAAQPGSTNMARSGQTCRSGEARFRTLASTSTSMDRTHSLRCTSLMMERVVIAVPGVSHAR